MLAYDIVLIILEFLMRDGCRLCNGYFCPAYPPNGSTTRQLFQIFAFAHFFKVKLIDAH